MRKENCTRNCSFGCPDRCEEEEMSFGATGRSEGVMGLDHDFAFEGTVSEDGEISVKVGICQGSNKVGKCVG